MTKLGEFELNHIYIGDARELAKGIPDNSVDLIFTDPPYPYEFIHTYSDLSEMAARILKPSGLVLAYSGQSFLPEVMNRLCEHLVYRWTIAIMHGSSQIVWGMRAIAGWKPMLVYSVDGVSVDDIIIHDIVTPTKRDKRFHEWGQSSAEAIKYIEKLTEPGAIVLDPFCGGGTIPVVCEQLQRNWLAFEIDPETAMDARKRVASCQFGLPLSRFADSTQQLDLGLSGEDTPAAQTGSPSLNPPSGAEQEG